MAFLSMYGVKGKELGMRKHISESPQETRGLPGRWRTRADLIETLKPLGIDADGLIARVRPKKVMAQAWLGRHLLEALDVAPALLERKQSNVLPAAQNKGGRRSKRPADDPLEPLQRILRGES
jgi:hypothetical protein